MKSLTMGKYLFLPAALFLLTFLPLGHLYAQAANSTLKFVKYSTRMGLSSNAQKCVIQDREGFIWIGTDDGLNRFDGHTFRIYRRNYNDLHSLRSNIISSLFVDSRGILWVGTYAGGLSRYSREQDNFDNFTANENDTTSILNNDITAIEEDSRHRIWVGTTNGLHLFNPSLNGFIRFTTSSTSEYNSKAIANNIINTITRDGDILWISYGSGILSALNTSDLNFRHYRLFDVSSQQMASFSVNSLVLDNNKIWISTWSKGIWIFDKSNGTCRPYDKESSRYVNFIFKDNRGRWWYGPESKGLMLNDGHNIYNYHFDDYDSYSLSTNSLSSIFQDRQGNLWLTGKQGDLNYVILDNPFSCWYKNPNSSYGLSNNKITAVLEDSKKRIWIAYLDGGIDIVDKLNHHPTVRFRGDQSCGLGPGAITYIYESRNGVIWVCKYLDGLKKFDEASKRFTGFYPHDEGSDQTLAGNDVRFISEDSHGNMWFSIHGGGIDKFDPAAKKFTHFKHDENNPSTSILSDWTFTAVCDRHDNIWVASVAGVSMISEKSSVIKHYRSTSAEGYNLSNNTTRVIFPDSKGYIWIGTIDGLNRLDLKDNTIRKFTSNEGLPNTVIMGILEDKNNNLWISTAKGLAMYSPEKETFRNYSVQDGLVTDEFNAYAFFGSRDDGMYFGGRDGLNYFHPDNIRANTYCPPVYLIDLKLFNRSVRVSTRPDEDEYTLPQQISYCKEIELGYQQNFITLDFVALNYLNLQKNQYRYKLEGFEKYWTPPGYKREVTYTNLPPGEYIFRVIASNNDGLWNNAGAALKITIHPPFWKTKLAYVFYILFIIFLAYLFRRIVLHEVEIKRTVELEKHEIQKLQEMDSLKMQFFSNVSHEFRTPLTLILGPVEMLIKNAKDQMQKIQLKLIYRNATRLLNLINQLMDLRKIEEASLELNLLKNDIVSFVRDLVCSFEQEAKQCNINLNFNVTNSSYDLWFDPDKIEMIMNNLLSNAFKFTPDGGMISVSLLFEDQASALKIFTIKVKDSGIGIPREAQSRIFDRFYQVKNSMSNKGTGIGLSFASELVKLHMGSIKVMSEPGLGSEFTVMLPLWINESELPSAINIRKQQQLSDRYSARNLLHIDNQEQALDEAGLDDNLPRLLIIEDNPDMRFYIKNEFIDSYRIFEAHNGKAGLEKAFNEIPDAIICDVMMPEMDGFEVCKTLKQDERTSHIPLLMLTARSSEQYTIEGFESGADDYVSKPFSSAVLKARVKNLIESRMLLRKKFLKEPFAAIKDITPSKTDEKLFQKAYAIVEKNLDNPDLDVNEFAKEIGMSRTQLYRKINAISGQSVKEFIRIIRLKKSAEMFASTDMNITEVAYAVGFNSLSYFTTSFTEYFGMSPSKYIEKYIRA